MGIVRAHRAGAKTVRAGKFLCVLEWGRWPCAARRARISRALVGRTSVPAVWINGQFVGGCNDEDDGGGDWRTARFFGSRVGYLTGGSAGALFPIDNLFAFNKNTIRPEHRRRVRKHTGTCLSRDKSPRASLSPQAGDRQMKGRASGPEKPQRQLRASAKGRRWRGTARAKAPH